MTEAITSLIEKLEAASEGSRELDCLIAPIDGFVIRGELYGKPAFCRQDDDGRWNCPGQSGDQMVPRYSTSLDAALALAERVLPGWTWMVERHKDGRATAWLHEFNAYGEGLPTCAATPELALCAAILRAKASNPEGEA